MCASRLVSATSNPRTRLWDRRRLNLRSSATFRGVFRELGSRRCKERFEALCPPSRPPVRQAPAPRPSISGRAGARTADRPRHVGRPEVACVVMCRAQTIAACWVVVVRRAARSSFTLAELRTRRTTEPGAAWPAHPSGADVHPFALGTEDRQHLGGRG